MRLPSAASAGWSASLGASARRGPRGAAPPPARPGRCSAITRQMRRRPTAPPTRPATGSRHAPSARSSSWPQVLRAPYCAAATGPDSPGRASPARRSTAPSPELVLAALVRGGSPASAANSVAQRAQFLGRRVAHRRRPARPLRAVRRVRQAAPGRRRAAAARTSPSADPCGSVYAPLLTREAPRAAQPRPVRRLRSTVPHEPLGVHERLREFQRVAVPRRLPVRAQPPHASRDNDPRRQVRDPLMPPAAPESACCSRSGASAGTAPTGASPASGPAART